MPRVLPVLALLCIVAYLPTLHQPFLEDDYPHITLAQHYGDPANWRELADHPFRFRATAEWFFYAAWNTFGLHPAGYYAMALVLHILNTWLVYAAGAWPLIGFRVSAWAAAFFAIYEGHQEAVMWLSACNELWQFLFVVAAFVCWLHFLFGKPHRRWWYAGGLVCFALALISKESAPAFIALLALPLVFERQQTGPRRLWFLPYLAVAATGLLWLYSARTSSFRFQDGSFDIHSPFSRILPSNFARLFWFWGLLALAWAWKQNRKVVLLGLVWAAIALLPYSFLSYSLRIPSRQTYLASAGVAWIVAAGVERIAATHRKAVPLLCAVLLLHNVGYLWIKKRHQYLERAEPTEQLIAFAKRTPGPIYVECFPRPQPIAEEAVHLGAGKPASDVIWNADAAKARGATATFCYKTE